MVAILVPDLGDGIEKVEVASWLFKQGDAVTPDDDVVELVTDKASFCVPASAKGVLKKITVPEGAEASIGDILGEIE